MECTFLRILSVLSIAYGTSPPSFGFTSVTFDEKIFDKVDFERKTSNFINIANIEIIKHWFIGLIE